MKYNIENQYRNGVHYAWCSEQYDSAMRVDPIGPPPVGITSDPAYLYNELKRVVQVGDKHYTKIKQQRLTLSKLAKSWETSGEITTLQKDEILYTLKNAPFSFWRPLLYIIPRQNIEPRLKLVPLAKRATLGIEYIIEDLQNSEFDVMIH